MQGKSGSEITQMKEVQSSKNCENVGDDAQQVPSGSETKSNVHKAGEKPYFSVRRTEQKRKEKYKDKFRWEEGSSQIYRLTLSHVHLTGRLYFAEYDEAVVYTVVALVNLVAHESLSCAFCFLHIEIDERARKFDLIPYLMGSLAVYKIVRLLAQVGWQRSTSRMSELTLSVVLGFAGFVLALCVLFFASSLLLDCGIETLFSVSTGQPIPGGDDSKQHFGIFMISPSLLRIMMGAMAGLVVGILVTPAHRVARSFWLGTDQLQWNIPMAKWDVITRYLLHVNVALPLFSSIIWIKPMASLFVTSEAAKQSGVDGQVKDTESFGAQFWGSYLLPAPSGYMYKHISMRLLLCGMRASIVARCLGCTSAGNVKGMGQCSSFGFG
ncbi:hypothetical protein L7F22_068950 [Adiantum nelumboides]|nr:hypothetical protein [Adiantum nelumboides]